MANDDLIRRGDAHAVVLLGGSPVGMSDRINALPAQGVDARKVIQKRIDTIISEEGSWEPDTNVTNLPEWAETAVEELDAILAALAPAEAGGVEARRPVEDLGDGRWVDVEPAPVDALVKAAGDALQQLDDLIANSEGVAGLHKNGDVADWESLMDGGAFGEWLYKLEELRAALAAYRGGAK